MATKKSSGSKKDKCKCDEGNGGKCKCGKMKDKCKGKCGKTSGGRK